MVNETLRKDLVWKKGTWGYRDLNMVVILIQECQTKGKMNHHNTGTWKGVRLYYIKSKTIWCDWKGKGQKRVRVTSLLKDLT